MFMFLAAAAAVASSPPPLMGDFDHDGKRDKAEIRKGRKGTFRIVVTRGINGRQVIIGDDVKESSLANLFLVKERPGRLPTWCGKIGDRPCKRRSVFIHGDVLAFGTKESSEAVAIWTGRKFEVVWISD